MSTKTPTSSTKIDSMILKHLWELVYPYRFQVFLAVIILLIGKGIMPFVPLGIKYGIDIIQGREIALSVMDYQVEGFTNLTLTHISLVIICILSIQFVMTYLQIFITNRFGQDIMRDLRAKLFQHVMDQSLKFFDRSNTGQLLTRIVHDVQTLNELFVSGISNIVGDVFLILCIFIFSFWLDYRLALISMMVIPFLYWGLLIFKKFARKSFLEIRNKLAKMNAFLQATMSGMKVVQVFNKQNQMKRAFRRIQRDYFYEYLKTVRIYALYFPGVEFFSILSRILIVIVGGYWVYTGEAELSTVIAFLFYSPMFFFPLRELSEQYNVLQAAMASSEKIFTLLNTDEIIKNPPNPIPIKDFKGEIEFRNVSFSYKDGLTVLNNLSFHIKPGEKVALVGLTGSGKTTIINLISRLYEIQEGEIFVDGINIKSYNRDNLRKMISYVLQDVFVFSDTIKENIRLYDLDVSDETIQFVADKVQANGFISRLPKGYDEVLGERGVGLSFGEKQLLSFARAFIQESKIVIFDEATANIDLKTESIIQKNIKELIHDKTAIIIAHRLSTIREVDKIIVIHKGHIKEVGSHTELIRNKGLYEKLYRLQFDNNFVQSI